jgi:hypothetical protein
MTSKTTDRDTLPYQQVFSFMKAHIEYVVDQNCIANDAVMKAMSYVGTHQQISQLAN